jgi:hypothetical protein
LRSKTFRRKKLLYIFFKIIISPIFHALSRFKRKGDFRRYIVLDSVFPSQDQRFTPFRWAAILYKAASLILHRKPFATGPGMGPGSIMLSTMLPVYHALRVREKAHSNIILS